MLLFRSRVGPKPSLQGLRCSAHCPLGRTPSKTIMMPTSVTRKSTSSESPDNWIEQMEWPSGNTPYPALCFVHGKTIHLRPLNWGKPEDTESVEFILARREGLVAWCRNAPWPPSRPVSLGAMDVDDADPTPSDRGSRAAGSGNWEPLEDNPDQPIGDWPIKEDEPPHSRESLEQTLAALDSLANDIRRRLNE